MPDRIEQLQAPAEASRDWLAAALDGVVADGFDTVLVGDLFANAAGTQSDFSRSFLQTLDQACHARGLAWWLDLVPDDGGEPVLFTLGCARTQRSPRLHDEAALDPRRSIEATPAALPPIETSSALVEAWRTQVVDWTESGASGFVVHDVARLAASFWRDTIEQTRARAPALRWVAWTPGLAPESIANLVAAGFDTICASLAWWDGRSDWLIEEQRRHPCPVRSLAFPPEQSAMHGGRWGRATSDANAEMDAATCALLWCAAALFDSVLVPASVLAFARTSPATSATRALADCIMAVNTWLAARAERLPHGAMRALSAPHAAVTAIARANGPDLRAARNVSVVLVNPDRSRSSTIELSAITAPLGGFGHFRETGSSAAHAGPINAKRVLDGSAAIVLEAGEVRVIEAERSAMIALPMPRGKRGAEKAMRAPRIAIEAITPAVDGGRFPAKRVAGEAVEIEADVLIDGHEKLAVALLWRAADEKAWNQTRMRPLGNDRYSAGFVPTRIGRHVFAIEAWRDVFATWRDELDKKFAAGLDVSLEIAEGRKLVEAGAAHASAFDAALGVRLAGVAAALADETKSDAELPNAKARRRSASAEPIPPPTPDQVRGRLLKGEGQPAAVVTKAVARFDHAAMATRVASLLAANTLSDMAAADARAFVIRSDALPLDAERIGARFASWYELFPRSLGNAPGADKPRHGTFDDVIARLPAIREMGFDVLYFPPIHPIGTRHRKGKNNSLVAIHDDPGSPYAIGSPDGGHDAIHSELGGFDDFHRMRDAAFEQGLELALDFAIQCSPDHPWLADHPGWFAWRPDGSLRYAENPPKKYEDIVNVDFYADDSLPALWLALRDIVLFWVDEGVRIFRVDNPHTKPLPFWEWLIADVRGKHPDTIFLAEAFTRPKLMYRLAKLGFSQSYTYFTWRHTKDDFIVYLTELTQDAPRDFFRPHFFVNTPDINPYFLQRSGRAGFLIRAALASMLSGLWGVYSGFELCEATPVAGKEEYLDSEKYAIRARDWQRPGNIIAEIALLNRIRRGNPALHTHLGISFLHASDPNILYFSKSTENRGNVVLVAINLDPHAAHEADIEVPLWDWGLPDDGKLAAVDLVHDVSFVWHGKAQRVRLDPAVLPFSIWRIAPA